MDYGLRTKDYGQRTQDQGPITMTPQFIRILFVLLVCLSSFGTAQTLRSRINGGNTLYKDQKFTDAEVEYRKSLEENNQPMEGYFNLGDALFKQQRYEEAIQNYKSALFKTNDPKTAAQLYHNLGNVHVERKSY